MPKSPAQPECKAPLPRAVACAVLAALWAVGCGINDVDPSPIQAPFAVSDYFSPSGFMGDGSATDHTPEPIAMTRDEDCAARPSGARGVCYRFIYTPLAPADGGVGWGGVYWQSPANNWGQDPPQKVTPNADRVAFYAAGQNGGESVTFLVGGLHATDPNGAPLPYADTLSETGGIVLTNAMARYEIPIADHTYAGVIGGFGFSISSVDALGATIYLDDIMWLAPGEE